MRFEQARGNPADHDAPLRLAYLTYRGKPHVGGQGVYTRHLTKALVDLGHHVEVLRRPALPGARRAGAAGEAAEPRHLQRPLPGPVPGVLGAEVLGRSRRGAQFSTGTFSEPLAFSLRALRELQRRQGEFDLVHDNQSLGYGLLRIEQLLPTIVTLHHPISKDRELEMAHAPSAAQAPAGRPLVLVRQDAGAASPARCRASWW